MYQGTLQSIETYSRTYDLLWKYGPQVVRFPLRKANAVRFFSMFVTSQLFGIVISICTIIAVALILFLLITDWAGLQVMQGVLIGALAFQLFEMFVLRSVLVPLVLHYKMGPAIFFLEIFYFIISIVKGFTRLVLLVVINLNSFYTPAKCAFPDGKESWDSGHLTFVCYTMARVEADKKLHIETALQIEKAQRIMRDARQRGDTELLVKMAQEIKMAQDLLRSTGTSAMPTMSTGGVIRVEKV